MIEGKERGHPEGETPVKKKNVVVGGVLLCAVGLVFVLIGEVTYPIAKTIILPADTTMKHPLQYAVFGALVAFITVAAALTLSLVALLAVLIANELGHAARTLWGDIR